jgi:hypothetical protein
MDSYLSHTHTQLLLLSDCFSLCYRNECQAQVALGKWVWWLVNIGKWKLFCIYCRKKERSKGCNFRMDIIYMTLQITLNDPSPTKRMFLYISCAKFGNNSTVDYYPIFLLGPPSCISLHLERTSICALTISIISLMSLNTFYSQKFVNNCIPVIRSICLCWV